MLQKAGDKPGKSKCCTVFRVFKGLEHVRRAPLK